MARFDKDEDRTAEPRWAETFRQNRIRDAVYREVIHQSWGCQLWVLERLGHIDKLQREAGDAYFKAYHNLNKGEDAERYYNQIWKVLGAHAGSHHRFKEPWLERKIAHEVIIEESYPGSEVDKKRLRNALIRLQYYLRIGNKRATKNG